MSWTCVYAVWARTRPSTLLTLPLINVKTLRAIGNYVICCDLLRMYCRHPSPFFLNTRAKLIRSKPTGTVCVGEASVSTLKLAVNLCSTTCLWFLPHYKHVFVRFPVPSLVARFPSASPSSQHSLVFQLKCVLVLRQPSL